MKVFERLCIGVSFIFLVALAPGFMASQAMGATLTFSFTGEVDHVTSVLRDTHGGLFNTSQTMSGTFTANTLDTNANVNRGNFTVTNFTLNIGGGTYTATMGTSGVVELRTASSDRFNLTVAAPNGPNVSFLGPSQFDFNLRGPSGTLLSANSLPNPMPPPSVSDFSIQNRWRLFFGPVDDTNTVRGHLTSLQAVPLPASVILFGAGLVALIGLSVGSRRQQKSLAA